MGVFRMPSLGSDMEAGTLVEWMIRPGDVVQRGDVVAVIETQKGAIEIDTFETGTVRELIAQVGASLPVGAPLAVIGEVADNEEGPVTAPSEVATAPAAPPIPSPAKPSRGALSPQGRVRASPAARKAASAAGINLLGRSGTGPDGAIMLRDVEGMHAHPDTEPTSEPRSEMRRAVAAAMERSKREIPHFYMRLTIDIQPLTDWLAAHNEQRNPEDRILMGAANIKAAALAAKTVPEVNGFFVEGTFRPSSQANVGMVISLRGGGLVVPAITDVGSLSLQDVMDALRDITKRARAARLRSSEISTGTFTVSSLGDGGAEEMTGVIYPPQVALLAIGSPVRRPWIVEDAVVPRIVCTFALSVDHRVCDGRAASKYLLALEKHLSRPEDL